MTLALAAALATGLFGTVDRSPAMPICRAGQSCATPAAGVRLDFTRGAFSKSVVTTSTGRYRVRLAPGRYRVHLIAQTGRTRLAPTVVIVPHSGYKQASFSIDPGIR